MIDQSGMHERHVGYRVTAVKDGETAVDMFDILRGALDAVLYLEARGWTAGCVEVRQLIDEETLPIATGALAEVWARP